MLELIEKDPKDSVEEYEDDLRAFRKILQDTNVMCRIANCNEKFDVDKLKKFCEEAYIHRVESFDWAILSTSTHRGLGHLTELVRKNGGNWPNHLVQVRPSYLVRSSYLTISKTI